MKFVVTRSKWLRGRRVGSMLRNGKGLQCCLGFVAEQCGISPEDTLMVGMPGGLPSDAAEKFYSVVPRGRVTARAAAINDDEWLSDAEREGGLRALFFAHGH